MSQFIGNSTLAFARTWHAVSAKDRVLGPLAVNIASILMGKHKPVYDPSKDCGDYVVVTDAKQVVVTGRKADQRVYRHHTMFPGGLKEIKYKEMMEKRPEEIIRKAVSGMLPKNTLRDRRLERLKVFDGEEHPYGQNVVRRYTGETFFGWLSRSGPSTSQDDSSLSSSRLSADPASIASDRGGSAVRASSTPSSTTASAPSASPSSSHLATASASSSSTTSPSTPPSPPTSPSSDASKANLPIKGKLLARDQELLAKLLDREGGSAGVSIVNGRYEEGLGPETKKNMFRLI
ncbi:Ribosomal protein L13 [Kalmanozyma brasiliensis GHG001]|uniref:Ribosomal protein L13 n=1 Tax=Kalmanozyma brasiliensis (strain GHG001) TaxID=1365824 RepID=UPI0028680FF6|nr:Ribosomal protein L13 [Kalmanozyma brasiliensis GHG001]EST10025.2 Ribosomal protein L13 [Kalmanozyma brasiliensis GHG001]